eukprot:3046612-Pyramimonas_sp.AAC.2
MPQHVRVDPQMCPGRAEETHPARTLYGRVGCEVFLFPLRSGLGLGRPAAVPPSLHSRRAMLVTLRLRAFSGVAWGASVVGGVVGSGAKKRI